MATLQDLYTVARRLTVEMRGGLVGIYASLHNPSMFLCVYVVCLVGVTLKTKKPLTCTRVSTPVSCLDSVPSSLFLFHLTLSLSMFFLAQEKLEGAEARGTIQASTSLSRDMHAKLRELSKVTQQIESQWRILVVQENASKRDLWKRKVEQVVEDCDQFRVALERFKGRVSPVLPRSLFSSRTSPPAPSRGFCWNPPVSDTSLFRVAGK